MKYFSQAQLIVASLQAEKRGYNRQLETDLIWKNTKASDKFPVLFSMPHEHAGGVPCDLHMRCIVEIDGQPVQIDTDMEIFETLEDL